MNIMSGLTSKRKIPESDVEKSKNKKGKNKIEEDEQIEESSIDTEIRVISKFSVEKIGLNKLSVNLLGYMSAFYSIEEMFNFVKLNKKLRNSICKKLIFLKYIELRKKEREYIRNGERLSIEDGQNISRLWSVVEKVEEKDKLDDEEYNHLIQTWLCKNVNSNVIRLSNPKAFLKQRIKLAPKTAALIPYQVPYNTAFMNPYTNYYQVLRNDAPTNLITLTSNEISRLQAYFIFLLLSKENSPVIKLELSFSNYWVNETPLEKRTELIAEFRTIIVRNKFIKTFVLRNSQTELFMPIFECLKMNSYLEHFSCDIHFSNEADFKILMPRVYECLNVNNSIQNLEIKYANSFNELEGHSLNDFLAKNQTIKRMVLELIYFPDYFSFDGLIQNDSLEVLSICGSTIKQSAMEALCKALVTTDKSKSILHTLIINIVGFDKEYYIDYLTDIVSFSPTITTLDLSLNLIDRKIASTLFNALETNTTLKTLILKGNMLGNKGFKKIISMLKANRSLTDVDVSSNNIKCEVDIILDMLEENNVIRNLEIHHNQIDIAEIEKVEIFLQGRR